MKYDLDFGSDITFGFGGLENTQKSGNRTSSAVQFRLQATRDSTQQVELARHSQAPGAGVACKYDLDVTLKVVREHLMGSNDVQ